MKNNVLLVLVLLLSGCASQPENKSFEELSALCSSNDLPACYQAADRVYNLSANSLMPCAPGRLMCIDKGETKESAMVRINDMALEFSIKSCDRQSNAQACIMAGAFYAGKANKLSNEDYKPVAEKSDKYFEKACKLGLQMGCRVIGATHRAGT